MSKRKGKDKNKIESKPPYFDFATIKLRSFQVILVAIFVASLGIYAPVFFLVSETFILLSVYGPPALSVWPEPMRVQLLYKNS